MVGLAETELLVHTLLRISAWSCVLYNNMIYKPLAVKYRRTYSRQVLISVYLHYYRLEVLNVHHVTYDSGIYQFLETKQKTKLILTLNCVIFFTICPCVRQHFVCSVIEQLTYLFLLKNVSTQLQLYFFFFFLKVQKLKTVIHSFLGEKTVRCFHVRKV